MIYTNRGKVDFEGKGYEIMSDVVMLLRALIDEDVIDEDDLQEINKLVFMSHEEVNRKAKELLKSKLKEIHEDEDFSKFFKDIFGDLL